MSDRTGVVAVDGVVVWCVAIAAMVGVLGMLWRIARGVARLVSWAEQMRDDWQGIPDRPGVPGRPGVMERIGGAEKRLVAVETRIGIDPMASL